MSISRPFSRALPLVGPIAGFSAGQGLLLLANVARVPVTIQVAGVGGYADVLLLATITAIFAVISFGAGDIARIELMATRWHRGDTPNLVRTSAFVRLQGRWLLALSITLLLLGALPVEDHVQSRWVESPALTAAAICVACGILNIALGPYLAMLEIDSKVWLSNAIRGTGAVAGLALVLVGFQMSESAWVSASLWAIGTLIPFGVPVFMYGRWSGRWSTDALGQGGSQLGRIAWIPLTAFAATALDPFVVQFWLDAEAVTEYGVANRLAVVVLFVPLALRSFVWLSLGRSDSTPTGRGSRAALVVAAFAASSIPGAVGLALFGPWVATLMTGSQIEVGKLLYLVFGISGAAAAGCIACQAVAATSSFRAFSVRLSLSAAITNVLLSFALTPGLHVMGPAIAGAICNLGVLVTWVWKFRGARQQEHGTPSGTSRP